ncbi:MAG: hypothetical protein KYQ20_01715 [Candidatus Nealsonbacteria bacterium]|nr:hypothetical protein [Candidatus Nealsonbacteria bacterium]
MISYLEDSFPNPFGFGRPSFPNPFVGLPNPFGIWKRIWKTPKGIWKTMKKKIIFKIVWLILISGVIISMILSLLFIGF